MFCVKCKKEIDEGDIFCGYCGVNQAKFKKYLERVTKKIHRGRDESYNKNVNNAYNKVKLLEKNRADEIRRIINGRWQSFGTAFSYNLTEGKVIINGANHLFSEINGAEIVKEDSYRTVTKTVETGTTQTKKHASIGGGLVGAMVAGPVGAVVGGTVLGKKRENTNSNVVTNSDNIPTCFHIGVNVNINGFNTEIILLSKMVDKSSSTYNNAIRDAQMIVEKLRELSQTPVPDSFLQPEEEQSVISIDQEIKIAEEELQSIKNNIPTYEIPDEYYN